MASDIFFYMITCNFVKGTAPQKGIQYTCNNSNTVKRTLQTITIDVNENNQKP